MNSFYGGKQGNSFIISKSYTSIAEMAESFGKNKSDCPVNFDEYVLINTINKNNPENGQIFRRGYDYNDDKRTITSFHPTKNNDNPYETKQIAANGAVYIGTIVGPAGRAPIFHFDHYDKVDNLSKYKTLNPNALFTYSLRRVNETSISKFLYDYYNKKTKIDKDVILGELNILTKDENFHDLLAMMVKEDMSLQEFYYLQLGQPEPLKAMPLALDFNEFYANIDISIIDTAAFNVYYYYDTHYKNNQETPSDWYIGDLIPIKNSDTFHPGHNLIPGVTYAYNEKGELKYDVKDGKRSMRKGTNELGNTYQDTIDWTYCTVRNENLEDSTAYVGFRFASPVVEFETESVLPYYHRSDTIGEDGLDRKDALDEEKTTKFTNLNLIERLQSQEDIEQHPFYSLWKIAIPKGIKGEGIQNFRCITANENVYSFKLDSDGNLCYDKIGKILVEDYKIKEAEEGKKTPKQDDIDNKRQIFVFDYINYDRVPEGDIYTIYAGDYNVLKQNEAVKLDHNGQLTFTYTHDDSYLTKSEDWIHWIDKIHFNEDGTVTITFNDLEWNVEQADNQDEIKNGVLTKPYLLHWINQMNFADDGTITVDFNNEDLNDGQIENGHINLPKLVKWINKISLDKETGHFYIEFNNDNVEGLQTKNIGTEEEPKFVSFIEQDLTWVKDIEFKEDGTIITDYTTDYQEGIDKRTQSNFIKWIKNISLDEDTGHFIVNFNYEKEPDSGVATQINQFLTWIKDIRLDEDGTVHWDYTTSEDNYQKDNYIKWIKNVRLDADKGDFEVTFNYDTEEKPTRVYESLQWVKDISIAADGTITTDYTNQDDKVQTKFIKWLNSISLTPDDGHFVITYNHDTDVNGKPTILDTHLIWVKDVHVNADGSVTYTRTTDTVKQTENPLTWITGFTFEDNGDVRVTFNNSTISTIEKNIQWINDIIVNDDGAGNGNQKLSIKYNNKNNYIDIGSPLNYVMRMAVNFANGDLLALYSDPEKRKSGYSYDGVSGWTVLGNVKYSKSMTKEAYNNATAAERVSDLIAGAVCYRTEVIE